MQIIQNVITWINGYLWGPPMLVLLLGTHLFLTIRLGFIQRFIGLAIRVSFKKDLTGRGDISHFGALTTSLAATIGTGNIVGVATAVALGGPGAVFWCWLTGVFGISTKYAEAVLAIKYRERTSDGTMLGGPMYALAKGLNAKWLAVTFCTFTALAAFGIGNMVQANSISVISRETFQISPHVTGLFLSILVGAVILGGIRSIAAVCERFVPVMALFYAAGCLTILVMNYEVLPAAVCLIVKCAFAPQAAGAGFVGATIMTAARYGISRGLFSNEAGLGSAPIVAAAAQTPNPVKQALVSSTGTFWDTVVVCAMTGLVLVSEIILNPDTLGALSGDVLTKAAFAKIPVVGPVVLSGGLFTFVFSTILGWSYYGERAVEYLVGKPGIRPYRVLWVIAVFVGATVPMPLVWDLADSMNALMVVPNLISLLLLSGVIVAETKKYLWEGRLDALSGEEDV